MALVPLPPMEGAEQVVKKFEDHASAGSATVLVLRSFPAIRGGQRCRGKERTPQRF